MITPTAEIDALAYAARRRTSALLCGEAEPARDPIRRTRHALLGSAALAVVTLAAAGLVGLFTGISTAEIPDNGVIVAKGSADRYVVIDDVVHPALNLSSAMLAGSGTITTVGADAIARAPKGPPVGIPGAPDVLPQETEFARGTWTACVRSDPPRLQLTIGLPAPKPLASGTAAVVRDSAGTTWLLAADGRYRLTAQLRTIAELSGSPSISLSDDLLGMIPIRATAMSASTASGVSSPFDLIVQPEFPLCLSMSDAGTGTVSIGLPATVPSQRGLAAVAIDGPEVAESVTVAGSGALVYDVEASEPDRVYSLVTDSAMRYEFVSNDAAGKLGYDIKQARGVAATLIALIPAGPTLDPTAARATA